MYSAGYRQTALDRLNSEDVEPTSVYTRVLVKKLGQPGSSIASVAREVRNEVQNLAKSVGHQQRPAYYDELSSRLVLNTTIATDAPASPVSDKLSADQRASLELAYWNAVKDGDDASLLTGYLRKYPSGQFADIARTRLAKQLNDQKSKKEVKVVAVQPNSPIRETEPTKPARPTLSKREITLRIQKQLVRHGCNPGRPDGAWGSKSRRALQAFARGSKKRLVSVNPSQGVLDVLIGHKGRGCPIVCSRRHVVKGNRCVLKTCRKVKSFE